MILTHSFKKTFRLTILFIILVELLSYLGYFWPRFELAIFFLVVATVLILSFKKLEYGIYILLAELFIGSKGYLFYFSFHNLKISIRLALFLVIFLVWLVWFLKNRRLEFKKSSLFKWYLALIAIIGLGIVNAFIRNYSVKDIFFDVNAYLFLGLVFVIFSAIKSQDQLAKIWQVFLAALVTVALKSLVLLFIFSHRYIYLMPDLYRWVRLTGVGEITQLANNFYRIFFQSQFFSLIGFFVILIILLMAKREELESKVRTGLSIMLFPAGLIIILSFSRSFWLTFGLTMVILLGFLFFKLKYRAKSLIKLGLMIVIVLGLEVVILSFVSNFPYLYNNPHLGPGFSASLLEERVTDMGEAGAASRWSLLKPLGTQIVKHPIIGTGFGTKVTFVTQDPRYIEMQGTNLRSTYAFEWGYLDILVKVGLFGLLVYLGLVFRLGQKGWQLFKNKGAEIKIISLGLLFGLIVLIITHATTPYLNHPLGLGYLIILILFFELGAKENA